MANVTLVPPTLTCGVAPAVVGAAAARRADGEESSSSYVDRACRMEIVAVGGSLDSGLYLLPQIPAESLLVLTSSRKPEVDSPAKAAPAPGVRLVGLSRRRA